MLQAAADALTLSVQVAGAIMAPSSDQYIQSKSHFHGDRSAQLSFQQRAELLQTMASDLGLGSWLHVSDAEAARDLFYLEVVEDLSKAAAMDPAFAQLVPPQLIFVTGCDRWAPLLHQFPGGDGVVVVPRAGGAPLPALSEWPRWARDNPCRVVAEPLAEGSDALSSTRLRKVVKSALSAEGSVESIEGAVASAAEGFMTPLAASKFATWFAAARLTATAPPR